ncbi:MULTISPECIES: GNAT family N-acetyltransferase [Rhodobacterales]|uniref:GNAT family N-acetyltransferase n=1 Tax=Roseobacter sp. N2S TaxID=2663844 RepID=UPI002861D4AB|nr:MULTISPECIES: GNAT family N-acetyltransferase [Rhodobacterales]MDR6267401.1 ElaA protein [Roseobacter sp. N2S]
MLIVETSQDLATCLSLRRTVFIEEQNVPEAEEIDGKDAEAVHILARQGKTPVGCARVIGFGTTAKIGRVCVLPEFRGKAVGVAILDACHDAARATGATRVILGAQTQAVSFYERLGYAAYGDVFDDAGIPHRMMERGL